MAIERGGDTQGRAPARAGKPPGLLGSLKDALRAAGRDETPPALMIADANANAGGRTGEAIVLAPRQALAEPSAVPSAADAARRARQMGETITPAEPVNVTLIEPPTTRVLRNSAPPELVQVPQDPRTLLARGRQRIARDRFAQDPVVGFLVVVGGPGLGAARAIFEGNNTLGRAPSNRIALDFGDETISALEQAYIRYDSTDRSFLFVPNLAKTNIVSVNDKRPTGAVVLAAMDIVTLGRTQVAFLPFCGPEFDWSELSDAKDT